MRLPEDPDLPPQIYLAPLIDVIFALLTFFIMSTLFLTRSQGLPVALPKAVTAESQKVSQVVITITPNGELALDKKPMNISTLPAAVREILSRNPKAVVVINADEKVPHGQVITVMDRLRSIPNIRLAIATRQP
ncbi:MULTISPECIES: ExbD/TolR family protein [Leptolyngbya]|jgi:biopolymer transport protein ExbD|uniref:Biopolymer transport protein ExbD/TolR n=1 Tax=Leptolyngbya boryana NIES-2135 TaxID=1973484 RepID=A0A1Z4JKI9_LEPBY|nr:MULTISPECIES: biopolymer transporter ExbD [Leptolyngbya]BAY57269.1 biopolymer transport protein ExbD/TolR [Leptolyngbya boryana NIES-2135]MBD1857414.1 biopolymer transporter ExbD [Leptolyngbya sp. FACHB-1624]MBD2366981.1 biopolymer transporter ExbD [Leptolyngbya sp. FACHB-161]MBD2373665.1 biopolymer transporter ExbD [Leptolyngbya sp. FACHB-238]MBD2398074.1 biopolymer transporter ExbD [Leptolyngbya sp. FACHB-239]